MKLPYSMLIYLFAIPLLFSQNEKRLHGQVSVTDAMTSHVLVLNLNTAQETFTDSVGKFSIDVHLGDLLIFQATHLDKMRKLIDEEAFASLLVEILMTSKTELLDEVTIFSYNRINAYDLGITATRIKTLTAAQRGKYANEPRALEFDENLTLIEKLERDFNDDFFNEFSIERERIKAFLYFAVEDKHFKAVAKENHLARTRFYLMTLAMDFNERQKNKQIPFK
jgi:hypothetical protein